MNRRLPNTKFGPGFLLVFVGLLLAQASIAAERPTLCFIHATVIDATGGPTRTNCTVVISGDRITEVGTNSPHIMFDSTTIVDAGGKFLIPGLWDVHVHWDYDDYLPLFIANGVTGIRIMWGMPLHHEWKARIEKGTLLGSRVYLASAIVDGPKPVWPGCDTASNAAEGRKIVQKDAKEGDDFVKVYSLLPRDAYFAIADESKKLSLPFEGHVPIAVSAEEASNAGQKSIEHLTGVLPACSTRETDLLQTAQNTLAQILATNADTVTILHQQMHDETETALATYSRAKADALFDLFKKNDTWQCPTLTVLRMSAFRRDPSFTNDARLIYMPSEIRSFWSHLNDNRLKIDPPEFIRLRKQAFQKEMEIVGAMGRRGAGIIAGTDTGNPYCFAGFSLHDELGLLVQAGLTPMQSLQAATRNAARFMGRGKDLGTVEPGKLADLVLLDANPLDDIANTRKIDGVVYRGRFYGRLALDGMLAKIESLAHESTNASAK